MSVGGTMLADADLRHEGGADRAVVEVAVGVLIRSTGDFLLTSRPKGKVYAEFWEFPGGKVEAGESVEQAREQLVDNPHALVRLNFCKVFAWRGELQMREGQSFSWQRLPVGVSPVLPGTVPVLQWFAAEQRFHDATHIVA